MKTRIYKVASVLFAAMLIAVAMSGHASADTITSTFSLPALYTPQLALDTFTGILGTAFITFLVVLTIALPFVPRIAQTIRRAVGGR